MQFFRGTCNNSQNKSVLHVDADLIIAAALLSRCYYSCPHFIAMKTEAQGQLSVSVRLHGIVELGFKCSLVPECSQLLFHSALTKSHQDYYCNDIFVSWIPI